ncbi:hypothetical protein [Thermogemmatispora sp.]|uniref:hypothetical protein n=3 Tax=Thermogemmatispora sp. TaxID=1968838 RepID=UPI002ACBEEF9|nr:hypothetical protein [Thermogemmatispora sp.]
MQQEMPHRRRRLLPFAVFGGMILGIVLLDAVLPLSGLWFSDVLLSRAGTWPLLPTQALFPTWSIIPLQPVPTNPTIPPAPLAWLEIVLFLAVLTTLFLLYLYALVTLPAVISRRYVILSTAAFGLLYALIPVVTSPDLFSYLIYARMGVIYHLNPLTTLPTQIHYDAAYPYLYWIDQPSAYGPTWAAITCFLQWLALPLAGSNNLVLPLLLLRLLGLATHLGSALLIWSISGFLQSERDAHQKGEQRRVLATLAFAWNPLLLFEAAVNAHNDSTLLFFILLAIWLLVRGKPVLLLYSLVILLFALAACLKINTVLLFPGLLLLLWSRGLSLSQLAFCLGLYVGCIVLLYAPFWDGGAVLEVLRVNPSASRNINTLAEFFGQFYNALIVSHFEVTIPIIGSPGERLTHTLSMSLFGICYLWLCWRALRHSWRIRSVRGLIQWLALVWLLYCAIGTPWFWPWYLVTFFGLYALLEASGDSRRWPLTLVRWRGLAGLRRPLPFRLLSLTMLMLYGSYAWALHGAFVPFLPGFKLAYLRGLGAWLLPLLLTWLTDRVANRVGLDSGAATTERLFPRLIPTPAVALVQRLSQPYRLLLQTDTQEKYRQEKEKLRS